MGEPIELIIGLGNPGAEYLMTRHNAGFWFVDALAARTGATFRKDRKLEAEIGETTLGGARVRLVKPTTSMNHSGRAAAKALNYFRIPPEHMLCVYDELDLPPGRAKLKFGGGHAGHNGMRSMIEHVGAEFWRIRLGVGHPGDRDRVVGHVLRRASSSEEERIIESVAAAIDAAEVLIEQGGPAAMNRLHSQKPDDADET